MQNSEAVRTQLYQILKPFAPAGFELETQTDLVADLDLDSMKVMDIVADVEDTFDIAVPLNILPEVRTVSDFVGQILKLLEEGS